MSTGLYMSTGLTSVHEHWAEPREGDPREGDPREGSGLTQGKGAHVHQHLADAFLSTHPVAPTQWHPHQSTACPSWRPPPPPPPSPAGAQASDPSQHESESSGGAGRGGPETPCGSARHPAGAQGRGAAGVRRRGGGGGGPARGTHDAAARVGAGGAVVEARDGGAVAGEAGGGAHVGELVQRQRAVRDAPAAHALAHAKRTHARTHARTCAHAHTRTRTHRRAQIRRGGVR